MTDWKGVKDREGGRGREREEFTGQTTHRLDDSSYLQDNREKQYDIITQGSDVHDTVMK